jgi:polyisoprenoid-binding protein YceI
MRGVTARSVLVVAALAAMAASAQSQARWTVDTKSSLAWWQVNPHLNHLWATTCPEETTWRPGEGRSGGWAVDRALKPPKQGYAAVSDTSVVPLYPRPEAKSICTEAVRGEVRVADPARWGGVTGEVAVVGAHLVTGEDRRDALTRSGILQTTRYPTINFTIDSVVNVTKQADTLRGTAVGVFTLHGVSKPMTAVLRGWPEGGGMRVTARLRVRPRDLTEEYGLSKLALGLGVTTGIWYDLFAGVDVVLRQQGSAGN